jgi:hypothetical protein
MDDLPHSASADVAKRLRALADGLSDPADIAAVRKYADELERRAREEQPSFKRTDAV